MITTVAAAVDAVIVDVVFVIIHAVTASVPLLVAEQAEIESAETANVSHTFDVHRDVSDELAYIFGTGGERSYQNERSEEDGQHLKKEPLRLVKVERVEISSSLR